MFLKLTLWEYGLQSPLKIHSNIVLTSTPSSSLKIRLLYYLIHFTMQNLQLLEVLHSEVNLIIYYTARSRWTKYHQLLNNNLHKKSQLDLLYSGKKLPSSWSHWRANDGNEMKKKNTAPWWFYKHKKILEVKVKSWLP